MEIERDKFVEINRKGNVGTFVYIPFNYPGPIAIDATIDQPERSKREDLEDGPSHLPDKGWPDKNAGFP